MRRTWKDYFEDQYNRDTHEQVDPNIGGFGGVQRGAYFGGDPVRRTEMVVRVGKLKNGKEEAPLKREKDWSVVLWGNL